MTSRQAPEIFQTALDSISVEGLPPTTDSGFEQAVIAHYALQYGAKGWNGGRGIGWVPASRGSPAGGRRAEGVFAWFASADLFEAGPK